MFCVRFSRYSYCWLSILMKLHIWGVIMLFNTLLLILLSNMNLFFFNYGITLHKICFINVYMLCFYSWVDSVERNGSINRSVSVDSLESKTNHNKANSSNSLDSYSTTNTSSSDLGGSDKTDKLYPDSYTCSQGGVNVSASDKSKSSREINGTHAHHLHDVHSSFTSPALSSSSRGTASPSAVASKTAKSSEKKLPNGNTGGFSIITISSCANSPIDFFLMIFLIIKVPKF